MELWKMQWSGYSKENKYQQWYESVKVLEENSMIGKFFIFCSPLSHSQHVRKKVVKRYCSNDKPSSQLTYSSTAQLCSTSSTTVHPHCLLVEPKCHSHAKDQTVFQRYDAPNQDPDLEYMGWQSIKIKQTQPWLVPYIKKRRKPNDENKKLTSAILSFHAALPCFPASVSGPGIVLAICSMTMRTKSFRGSPPIKYSFSCSGMKSTLT